MADEIPDSKVRKTLSFTHRQVFGATGIASLLIGLSQYRAVKDLFWTREEGKAQAAIVLELKSTHEKQFQEFRAVQADQIKEIKNLIIAQDIEHTHGLERLSDIIADKIKESEARSFERNDWIKKDVESLRSELDLLAYKMDANIRKKSSN
ncbi:MAG: hypothetical protein ACXWQE_00025 [Bdellovibrionales bacterium]